MCDLTGAGNGGFGALGDALHNSRYGQAFQQFNSRIQPAIRSYEAAHPTMFPGYRPQPQPTQAPTAPQVAPAQGGATAA